MVTLNRSIPALLCVGGLLCLPACTQSSPGGQPAAGETQAKPAAVQQAMAPDTAPAPPSTAPAPAPAPAPGAGTTRAPAAPPVETAARPAGALTDSHAPAQPSVVDTSPTQDAVLTPEQAKIMRDAGVHAQALQADVPIVYNIVAKPGELNLGEWGTNTQAVGKVTLVNTSDTAATITDCKTNCGCTTTNCPKGKTLNPGESTEVEVKVNTGAAAHEITKTVTFMVEGQQPLRVTVRADVKDYVAIEPARLDRNQTPDGKMTLTAKDGSSFKILSVSPSVVDGISTEAKASHEVFLNWTAWDELGEITRPQITFSIDHPKVDKVQTYVMVNRKAQQMKDLQAKGIDNLPLSAPPAEQQLAVAIRYGDTEAIRKALEEVKEPTARNNMLAVAASSGRVDAVGLLLDAGADIESTDSRGRTPVMCAVRARKADVLRALIARGARINAVDSAGVTALAWAAGPLGDASMVAILIESDANVNAVDSRGQTPLMWAARFGDAAKVSALLNAGADASAKDASGKTALDYARGRADDTGAAIAASLEKAAGGVAPG